MDYLYSISSPNQTHKMVGGTTLKLKLIDVKTDPQEEEMGTCELCFSTGYVDNPTFVFQTDKGKRIEVDGYYWDWGDYTEVWIDNEIAFAEYVGKQNYPENTCFDSDWLWNEVNKYDESKYEGAVE